MVRNVSSAGPGEKSIAAGGNKELVIGESFECEYFYEVLAASRSTHMEFKLGRQEDAQEFLSFLLNRLHEEMIKCLDSLNPNKTEDTLNGHHDDGGVNGSVNGGSANGHDNHEENEEDEWREVGRKNRAFVTRKPEFKRSPLSEIFCGQFRSVLSQPGVKDRESISLEPFFTLPLDIQVFLLSFLPKSYKN